MVQVDVFWAYGIGASLATAASHHLIAARQIPPTPEGERRALWTDPYLMTAVLYCGVLFAPSGAWLLWGFPDWETMQVAADHSAIPAWLVALFAGTNVSQGVLGYWAARRLILSGRTYAAYLQAGLGYLGMFFILVHGWDGRGYQRFFSADRAVFASWPPNPSLSEALSRAGDWLTSPVALTLYGMGVVLVPVLVALMVSWIRSGQRLDRLGRACGPAALVGAVALSIFGVALGTAIAASVLIHLLGWWFGVPVAALATWLMIGRRRTGLAYRVFLLLALPTSQWVHRDAQRS